MKIFFLVVKGRRRQKFIRLFSIAENKCITTSQCGNFKIFLSLRFYVKSILDYLEVLKLQFLPFLGL